ncbi:MAG: ParA family partition ATPase [Pseudomonadota bacterium]
MIIAFAQQKGGAGKTTVLAHLAHAWAEDGKSVGMVDLDPQRSLSMWAEHQSTLSLDCVESAGWRAGTDIKDMARGHDVTLIDCPGNASNLLEASLRESHLVLLPCQPSMLDAWATSAVLEMAEREKTRACVVLNRVPPRGGLMQEVRDTLDANGAMILEATLGNRVAFAAGLARGTTALGLGRTTRATQEVLALRDEIEALLAAA